MCASVLPASVCALCSCSECGGQKRALGLVELELGAVSRYVGAGN